MDPQGDKGEQAKTIGKMFRNWRLQNLLTMSPEERRWLEKPAKAPEQKEVVLYLGCGVMSHGNIIQTAHTLLERLRVDFVSVGGAAYCCGTPWALQGQTDEAAEVTRRTVQHMASFQPRLVLTVCPSCIRRYDDILQMDRPFPMQHIAEFLYQNREALPFGPVKPVRVGLHYHTGKPRLDAEAQAAANLLSLIPGVTLVDLGTSPAFSPTHCTPVLKQELGEEGWDPLVKPYLERAVEEGVDILALVYYGCYTMWCVYELEYPFAVENYLTAVGRSLGFEYEDRWKKYLHIGKTGNLASLLEDAAACAQANQIDPEEAKRALQRTFVERRFTGSRFVRAPGTS